MVKNGQFDASDSGNSHYYYGEIFGGGIEMKQPLRDGDSSASKTAKKNHLVAGLLICGLALWIASTTAASEPSAIVARDAREAVVRAIPLLQSSAKTWHEKQKCSSCHHQFLGITTLVVARDRGFKIDEAMFADEVRLSALRDSARDALVLGDVSINEQIGRSYQALSMGAAGVSATPVTDLLAHMLMGKQHVNGNWNSYSHRPPLEDSEFTATAVTIRALQLYTPAARRTEADRRIEHAQRWLATASPRSSEERAMRLFGLCWARASARRIEDARLAVLRDQREDGGWSQISTRASDAYATGQALVALNQAGGLSVDSPAYRRGIEFLLRTQQPDGTWLVNTRRTNSPGLPFFETGFPYGKHQFISYAATAWATMALALSTDGSPVNALVGPAPGRSPVVPANSDPLTPLMRAAIEGDLKDVDREIRAGANVNAHTQAGLTALMFAAHDPEKVRLLLRSGANPNAEAKSGHTALILAAGYDGAKESVRLLLGAGANVNAAVREGIIPGATPLVRAAIRGDTEMAKLLVDRGATLESGEPKIPVALLFAASQGDVAMVTFLLDKGEPVDSRWPREFFPPAPTVMMVALSDGYPELVRLLLARGAGANTRDLDGLTPLMWAAAAIDRGDTKALESLLAAGADPAATTNTKETAHTFAVRYENKVAAALLEKALHAATR
jgi:ankyrin repeat protein